MNKIILTGIVVKDPEIRYSKENCPTTHFKLKVGTSLKEDPEIIQCTAKNSLAKICAEYLKKDKLIAIEGKLQTRRSLDDNKMSGFEVLIENLQMLDTLKFKTEVK